MVAGNGIGGRERRKEAGDVEGKVMVMMVVVVVEFKRWRRMET